MAAHRFAKSVLIVTSLCFPLIVHSDQSSSISLPQALLNWQTFEVNVRDGLVRKDVARQDLPEIMKALITWADQLPFEDSSRWTFPVKGYDLHSIGGTEGDGFQPDIYYGQSSIKGYDFLDGNKHGGHPAHDIFIRDKDQDCRDDKTGKPVEVVAAIDCVVIQTEDGWKSGNDLRGGNVVWLYNPRLSMVFYYAHLGRIEAMSGQFVKQGTAIGTIGRTGKAAYEKRSPTHLHLMVLKYEDGQLKPYNFFKDLNRSNR